MDPLVVPVPESLRRACETVPERAEWVARVPSTVSEVARRWAIRLAMPFDAGAAWVAPAVMTDGTQAILKLGMPHLEGEGEIEGLRFWSGDPTVRLLECDHARGAMLLESADWRHPLRKRPEPEQDLVIAGLLRRLWRLPSPDHQFKSLSTMLASWSTETTADANQWRDPGLVREGLMLFEDLPRTADRTTLLATDLHAGNVLRSSREPWLVIDPKPFIGDPAYDATQHLLNCKGRLHTNGFATIARFADLLHLHPDRVRLWLFARVAAEPRSDWTDPDEARLARALAP